MPVRAGYRSRRRGRWPRSRLRDYLAAAGSAILDEPATARALADFWLRAVPWGAATEA